MKICDITGGSVEYLCTSRGPPPAAAEPSLRDETLDGAPRRDGEERPLIAGVRARVSAVNVSRSHDEALLCLCESQRALARRQKYAQVTGHGLARLGPPCLLRNLSRVRAVQYSTSLSASTPHSLYNSPHLQLLQRTLLLHFCSTLSGTS